MSQCSTTDKSRIFRDKEKPSGPNLISSIQLQLPEIPLTGDKAFQSVDRDKRLKMQITRKKECILSMLCLLRWGVQKSEEAQSTIRDLLRVMSLKRGSGTALPSDSGYLCPWLWISEGNVLVIFWPYSKGCDVLQSLSYVPTWSPRFRMEFLSPKA